MRVASCCQNSLSRARVKGTGPHPSLYLATRTALLSAVLHCIGELQLAWHLEQLEALARPVWPRNMTVLRFRSWSQTWKTQLRFPTRP